LTFNVLPLSCVDPELVLALSVDVVVFSVCAADGPTASISAAIVDPAIVAYRYLISTLPGFVGWRPTVTREKCTPNAS
jgi:hypothetical protein